MILKLNPCITRDFVFVRSIIGRHGTEVGSRVITFKTINCDCAVAKSVCSILHMLRSIFEAERRHKIDDFARLHFAGSQPITFARLVQVQADIVVAAQFGRDQLV